MKYFKLFDTGIQVMILIAALIVLNIYSFYLFYFVLGGWQVVSCLLHMLAFNKEERSRTRRMYEKTLAVVAMVTGVTAGFAFMDIEIAAIVLFIEGCIMVVGGITMAVWYWIDCLVETKKLFNDKSTVNATDNKQNNHI